MNSQEQTPVTQSSVDTGINRLEGDIAHTREKIAALEKRLFPILGEPNPATEAEKEVRGSECALLDKIIGLQNTSEENGLALGYIIDRLQI